MDSAIFAAIKSFFDTFGPAVFVPVVLYVIALCLKVTPKKAFMSALSAGVGLMGFMLIIGAFSPIVNPVIEQMVRDTGIQLPVYDMGWQNAAVIAYSTKIGMIFVGICLLLQIVLFLTRYTNVFQAGDLWNNYSYMAWGSVIYLASDNLWLALAAMITMQLYTLMCAEVIQKRWSTYYKYPQCTIASLHTVGVAPYAIAMNWLLDRVGLYKIKSDPETFRSKLGFIGEPMTLGLLLGLLIGFIGNITKIDTLAAWGSITSCGIATAAVMAVFPKISGIFAGAFTAITEASKKTAKGSKHSALGDWYLAVNDATGYGEPATLISGIVLMPIMLLLSFILPGNQVLPMIDLVAVPYVIQPIVASSNGNILKTVISGAIWLSIGLYGGTATGAIFTDVAKSVGGIELGAGIMMITSFAILCNPAGAILFLAFVNGNPITIGIAVIVYIVCYALVRKNRDRIHDWVEKQAENPGGASPAAA